MARDDTMTFRIDENERRLIAALAVRMERSVADTVRAALREAARARGLLPDPSNERPVRERQAV